MQKLLRRLEQGGSLSCAGVGIAAQPFFAALLSIAFPGRSVVVVADCLKTQESFHQDLETWLRIYMDGPAPSPHPGPLPSLEGSGEGVFSRAGQGSREVAGLGFAQNPTATSFALFYPGWEILPHESKLPHSDVVSERLETLIALCGSQEQQPPKARVIVASITALLQRTFPVNELRQRTRRMNLGDRIDPLDLVEWLESQGYEPEAQVTHKGEMALRGGILDVYPMTCPWPVRLEFFGDELESIREFDPLTQISRGQIKAVTFPPAGELGLLKSLVEKQSGKAPVLGSLLDYLPPGGIVVFCSPETIAAHAEQYLGQTQAGESFVMGLEDFRAELAHRQICCVEVSESEMGAVEGGDFAEASEEIEAADEGDTPLGFESLEAFRPIETRAPDVQVAEAQRREFFAQIHRWRRQGQAVEIFCNNEGERQRFLEIWKDYGFETNDHPAPRLGALSRGFIHEESGLVVVTDAEIFGRYRVQRPRRLKSVHAQAARSALDIDFTEFEEGDYVVHIQHGIGKFIGLKVLPISSGKAAGDVAQSDLGQECLAIEYAPGNFGDTPPKLYVPVSEAHLVSKYVGAGRARPPLNTLSGTRWAKAKANAEKAVADVASEMLAIQAARDSKPGHAFCADTPWQREFEGSFLYEETPDQMRAIVETKNDMEIPKPMDRLICGDVGFGKTEVAIRAAFKAVMDGRQVAVLVPTTVLAQQHFNTFTERMADYPVKVELLSRFRTKRQLKIALEGLPAGAVDIVIGTHRLLQKDVVFKDLGLVVIDEEQRFGVAHKEKFKRMRQLVDVLTLSATPIPRTLYLALTGARDMSTIETPPLDRLPVQTIVSQYDERLIREAIQRELNRGGQVFFLHNRVGTIENMAQKLRALLPKARIVVGHGQMKPEQLEEVMTSFVNGEAQVLLSTTIIESGLDIPNANTIIIDRADRFGLSDLYQLRGRVGRYRHQAYAYLLIPRHAGLLADARKRISAIRQYSTLGSGFKIAMRDLEIRGAGNLLGHEQSGQITAVGFELYCQLLKQSIAGLKGEKIKPRIEVQARYDFLALNPAEESYANETQAGRPRRKKAELEVNIPREVARYVSDEASEEPPYEPLEEPARRAAAYIPLDYISDSRQRIEVYRKLAQADDKASLERLRTELRDRFGPLPAAMELLTLAGEIKILASERGITVVEVKEGKLMLTRENDYLMLGGKFPRLTKTDAKDRLREIKKFLLAI